MSVSLEVLYFAALRDAAGIDSEALDTSAPDLIALYAELRERHRFPFQHKQLRVAVDGEFADWGDAPRSSSMVAFIPPVSGG